MYIVAKNSLLATSGAEILGGGNSPPHATHNSQGVGMERVKPRSLFNEQVVSHLIKCWISYIL